MDIKYLVTSLIAIPLILILAITVFHGLAVNSRSAYESTVTNESIKTGVANDTWFDLDYAGKKNTTADGIKVWNGTATAQTRYYNFSMDWANQIDLSRIHIGTDGHGMVNVTYTAYSGSGYESFTKVYDQTLTGQKLGSLFPYILIALAVVTVIIGAFGVTKLF